MIKSVNNTIALVGGGTGGPTTPLLAIAEAFKKEHPDVPLVFIGTSFGPSSEMISAEGIKYLSIPAAKFRRYFSLRNLLDFFILPAAVVKSLFILINYRVKVVVSAGSYVAVPVIWAAWFLRKKIIVHHQDVQLSLSTKLTSPLADIITLTFPEQKNYLWRGQVLGNPVRAFPKTLENDSASKYFNLDKSKPTLMIFGGGTGATFINNLTEAMVSDLVGNGFQVLHITGQNSKPVSFLPKISPGYIRRQFLTWPEMAAAYEFSDLVVCRAGMATISELSALGKPAIVIPMPNSHQEQNAKLLSEKKAAIILNQNKTLNGEKLFTEINSLVKDKQLQQQLRDNMLMLMPHDANLKISALVYNLFANT